MVISSFSAPEISQGAPTSPEAFRNDVMRLEKMMLSMEGKLDIPKDCPVRHIFAPGAYAREMTIPKGAVIIGKIHRHAHLNFISAGRVRVLTETGTQEIEAPHTFVSEVGTKRVVYAIEETIWTTVHITNETDLEKIEEQVIAKSYDDLCAKSLQHDKEVT